MKDGILESDRVFTVSPHYAKELVSGADKGVELESIIRKVGITGIVNGMDIQEWDPSTEKYLEINYDATTVRKHKNLNLMPPSFINFFYHDFFRGQEIFECLQLYYSLSII